LLLQKKGFRWIEALVMTLVGTIALSFGAQLWMAQPEMAAVMQGYMPQADVVRNPEMLYLAIGILGATVMPHNLYLHSSIVQTRAWQDTPEKKREAAKFSTWDSTIALTFALLINSAILIVSAATFHSRGLNHIAEIQDAHQMLSPLLGASLASPLFALALLASGQSSTLTATLAGQIVMEGFLQIKIPVWVRRLATRGLALIPAVLVILFMGEEKTGPLLVLSQVVLSLQLPFAVVPLVMFTSDRKLMGDLVSPKWMKVAAGAVATVIIGLNGYMLLQLLLA
jgi:manganese transport protein